MESCKVTIQQQQQVEFHGVRPVYPLTTGAELVNCYFSVPVQYRPEVGDFIGIYPANWSNLNGHYLVKQSIKPENVWSTPMGQKYGKIEFDAERLMQQIGGNGKQYYQFVYVKNGEYIHGQSTPFKLFAGLQQQQQQPCVFEQESIVFGGKPSFDWCREPRQTTGATLEQLVECEMEKLQKGIFGLEQGITGQYFNGQPMTTGVTGITGITGITGTTTTTTVYPTLEECQPWTTTVIPTPFRQQQPTTVYSTGLPTTTPVEIMCESLIGSTQQPHQIRKHWQSRIGEVEQMLLEQVRLEQAHRRIEQLAMHTQLKQYERHIQHVQRRQEEINEYLRAKQQQQVVEFEQKVYNIVKLGEIQQDMKIQQQPEYYVRKFEQLLKEKIEMEIQKRVALFHKMRQTIKECERKLREIQSVEQQHLARFHQSLKTRLGQFEGRYLQQQLVNGVHYTAALESELREQLRRLVAQWIGEQRREQYELIVKSHKQMHYLCQEIQQRLVEAQCQEIYSQLRIPTIPLMTIGAQQQYPICFYPQYEQHYAQVQQLEKQLCELKQSLRQRMIFGGKPQQQQQHQETFYQAVFGGLCFGEWVKPVSQKLRDLEMQLRQEKSTMINMINGGEFRGAQWYERKIQSLVQHINYFEQQQEQKQFEEFRLREVLSQLRALECDLCELIYNCQPGQYLNGNNKYEKIVALCQYLQQLVREKSAHLNSAVFGGEFPSVADCFVQWGNHSAWKRMIQFERKLVQLKSMIVERQQYHQVQQRLAELEQLPALYKQQQKPEQWRLVKQMLEESFERLPSFIYNGEQQQQHWSVQPECFVQHQQKCERLWQLVADLECQIQEQQYFNKIGNKTAAVNKTTVQQWVALTLIQQRFERLVQEFQQRILCKEQQEQQFARRAGLPTIMTPITSSSVAVEIVAQKCQEIVEYLRSVELQYNGKPSFFGQQLREKIAQFETILCEMPVEQKQWTVVIRQEVRDLKQQAEEIVYGCEYELATAASYMPRQPVFGGKYEQEIVEKIVSPFELERFLEKECTKPMTTTGTYTTRKCQVTLPTRKYTKLVELESESEEESDDEIESTIVDYVYLPKMNGGERKPTTVGPFTTVTGMKSLYSVEGLIGELESELVKMRLQKECYPTGLTATRVYFGQPEEQKKSTTTTFFVEPTPFGTIKVQQQQQKSTTQF